MRLLHVTAGNLFGGIERMLLTVASAATTDRAHEIAVCFEGRLARELREAGAAAHVLGDVRFRRPDSVWRARRALRTLLNGNTCDAVVAHAPWSCALAAPAARRAGVPILLWVHDAPHGDQWPERRVARMPPDRFICNSFYTAGIVAQWMPGVPRDVIYPPVPPAAPLTPGERNAIRAEFDATDATTVILLAARLEVWKGHRQLIEAGRQVRGDVAIWIAGAAQRPSEAAYLNELKSLGADPSSAGRVHFLGERSDVARLMASADVYCQPNTAPEPFGIALVEALAARVPVVTTAMGGALEIVDERCGLRIGTSVTQVAGALQRLIDDRALRARLGAGGPAQARRISDPAARLHQLHEIVRAQRLGSSAA